MFLKERLSNNEYITNLFMNIKTVILEPFYTNVTWRQIVDGCEPRHQSAAGL